VLALGALLCVSHSQNTKLFIQPHHGFEFYSWCAACLRLQHGCSCIFTVATVASVVICDQPFGLTNGTIHPLPPPTQTNSIGEMEQEFLDALSAYYYEGRAAMSDAEFELLKEELQWAGSKVVVLDSDEQRFLEAVRSWGTGKPIMTDEAFDQLRTALRVKGSIVAAAGPRCSLRSKRMYADATPDNLRMTALRTPAAALVAGAVLGADKIAGFDVSTVIPFLPSYDSDLIVLALLVAASYAAAGPITNLVLRDGVILKGCVHVLGGVMQGGGRPMQRSVCAALSAAAMSVRF